MPVFLLSAYRSWDLSALAKQFLDRLARGDWARGNAVPAQPGLERHVEGVVDRGAEVLRPHRFVFHVRADLVGRAVDGAAVNAAAGQEGGEAIRPVDPP